MSSKKNMKPSQKPLLIKDWCRSWPLYLPSDDTWYITTDVYGEEGEIRSLQKEDIFVPQLGWEFIDQSYFDNNFDTCKTRLANIENLENNLFHFNVSSERRPCVFPFNYYGVSHDRCTLYRADDIDNEKVS